MNGISSMSYTLLVINFINKIGILGQKITFLLLNYVIDREFVNFCLFGTDSNFWFKQL